MREDLGVGLRSLNTECNFYWLQCRTKPNSRKVYDRGFVSRSVLLSFLGSRPEEGNYSSPENR